jgi:starch synthase
MIAPILKADYPDYNQIKTIFTIHNLYYQGVFPYKILEDILGLEPEMFNISGVEFFGGVSFMKGGINYSDLITTVSHNYAEEIKTPLYGERLDEFFRAKSAILYGIENGIDYNTYDPGKDDRIFQKYDIDTLPLKAINKTKLQKELGLYEDENVPLIAIVTRLVKQKGIDLILTRIEKKMRDDAQIVVLGTGEKYYEDLFDHLKDRYPGRLSVNIKFDDFLAHKIYAAADLFLMPSLFEPCGLGQMIALKYGTIPIVRETGGLKDTVIPFNENTGAGNGFRFYNYNPDEMKETINYAIKLYQDKNIWGIIMTNAMKSDNSWEKSTKKYTDLYQKLMEEL